jgi:alginate O-acetyltransferase complex protein AlgI
VFLLTGAWHGASWNFIVWGAIHGFFLMMERWRPTARLLQVMPQALQHLYAMLVVMIAWVFFRAESLPDAIRYLGVMSGLGDTSAVSMSVRAQFGNLWPLIILGAILSFPVYPFLLRQCRAVWLELEAMALDGVLRAALLSGALVICAAIMAVDQYNPFIYFRF